MAGLPISVAVIGFKLYKGIQPSVILQGMGLKAQPAKRLGNKLSDLAFSRFCWAEGDVIQINLVLEKSFSSFPSDEELCKGLKVNDFCFREPENFKNPTEANLKQLLADSKRLLKERQPKFFEVGEKITLRPKDKLEGCKKLKMVPGFDRRDIPEILEFFNNCHNDLIGDVARTVGNWFYKEEKYTTKLGAELIFKAHNEFGRISDVTLLYNGHKLIGD